MGLSLGSPAGSIAGLIINFAGARVLVFVSGGSATAAAK